MTFFVPLLAGLLMALLPVAVEARYSILYSQKAPATQTLALTYSDSTFWTATKSDTTFSIVRFEPETYRITPVLTLDSRMVKGLHRLANGHMLALSLGEKGLYHLLEIDLDAKRVLVDRLLPKDWGALTEMGIEDDTHLWIASANPTLLRRIDASTLTPLSTIPVSDGSIHGLAIQGNTLWLGINRFNLPALIQTRDLKTGELQTQFEFHEAAGSISGLLVRDHLWILSNGIHRLLEVDLDAAQKTRPWKKSQFPLGHHPLDDATLDGPNTAPHSQRVSLEKIKIPSQLDWRAWMTSVKDQGQCGSCVAFSSVSIIEAQYRITHQRPTLDLDLSEQSAFSCSKGKCSMGIGFTEILDEAIEKGIPDEWCQAYTSGNTGADVACTPCAHQRERSITIDRYDTTSDYGFGNVDEVKLALQHGPLLTRMFVFDDFFYYQSGIYRHEEGSAYRGRHVVALVGYDDATQSFLVKNSWGPHWGESGYFRIAYDDISSIGATTYQIHISPHILPFALHLDTQVVTRDALPISLTTPDLTPLTLDLVGMDGTVLLSTLVTSSLSLPTATLPDGAYDLILRSPDATQERSQRFFVERSAPTTDLHLDSIRPAERKTAFNLSCSTNAFLPSVTIELSDGTHTITEEKFFPCPLTTFTIFHPTLGHPITARAHTLWSTSVISSNELTIDSLSPH